MTEAELMDAVIDTARTFGWVVAHFRPARTVHGWRTAVQADGAGFPDLVLVHAGRQLVWFREVKTAKGRLTEAQEEWGVELTDAGADWAVWREPDWHQIVAALSAGRAEVT